MKISVIRRDNDLDITCEDQEKLLDLYNFIQDTGISSKLSEFYNYRFVIHNCDTDLVLADLFDIYGGIFYPGLEFGYIFMETQVFHKKDGI